MKNARRMLAVALIVMITVCALAVPTFAEPSVGQLLRYIPTTITITEDETILEGYIVNLNTEYTISDFTDMEMTVWQAGEELFGGVIGDVELEVAPLSATYFCISFDSNFDLNSGEYDCDDNVYVTFSAGFSKSIVESSSYSFNFSTSK